MFFFFFFQAEDGIRDKLVTGVQTCALPIWPDGSLELDGIFTSNESNTLALLRVLQSSGWAGKVRFIGFDASDTLVKGLSDGHIDARSEEHTSELQSLAYLVCRLLLEKKNKH